MPSIEAIARVLAQVETASYGGEALSQLEHALQCAAKRGSSSLGQLVPLLTNDYGYPGSMPLQTV